MEQASKDAKDNWRCYGCAWRKMEEKYEGYIREWKKENERLYDEKMAEWEKEFKEDEEIEMNGGPVIKVIQ